MSDVPKEFESLAGLIESRGSPVTSEDVETYSKIQDVQNRGKKIKAVLDAWTAQEEHYRNSRRIYANCIISGLLLQGVVVNVAFFLIGWGCLKVEPWVANSFILGVFTEMATLSLIVFKYFFPSSPSQIAGLVEKL